MPGSASVTPCSTAGVPVSDHDQERGGALNRRDLLKKTAVGAAAAGVVWSAPRVEGLSMRPSYAAASSAGGTADVLITFNQADVFVGAWSAPAGGTTASGIALASSSSLSFRQAAIGGTSPWHVGHQ